MYSNHSSQSSRAASSAIISFHIYICLQSAVLHLSSSDINSKHVSYQNTCSLSISRKQVQANHLERTPEGVSGRTRPEQDWNLIHWSGKNISKQGVWFQAECV